MPHRNLTRNTKQWNLSPLLLSMIMLVALNSTGQNYIYKGEQQYPSTSTWKFPLTELGLPESIDITIAKTKTGGYLMLAVDVSFDLESISGTVSLILQNGKLITLNQRAVSDYVDNKSKVLYTISSAQLALLKENDIEKIRWSVVNSITKSRKSYTANNKKSRYDTERYNTANEVSSIED